MTDQARARARDREQRLEEFNGLSHDFEAMVEPPLADRIRAFERSLYLEPCAGPPSVSDDEPFKIGGCMILSNTQRMCAACRLRLQFYHCTYNAEAYESGPGEIPRRVTGEVSS